MDKLKKILLWAVVITPLAGYNLWPFMWAGFFSEAMAASYLLLFWLIKISYPKSIAAKIGFWFAINNMMDELFFDPLKFGCNEYFFAALITLLILNHARSKQP